MLKSELSTINYELHSKELLTQESTDKLFMDMDREHHY
jgi:hypothetical protein